MEDELDVLDMGKVKLLVKALCKGQHTFTENDLRVVLDWARQTIVNYQLMECVLTGVVNLLVVDNELVFKNKEQD